MYLCKLFRKFKQNFLTYCKNTSLHGFIYIAIEKYLILKIFWFIVCVSCLTFGSYLIYIQVQRFNSDVTRTSLTSTIYPVWRTPFPSVTICNYNAIYAKKTGYYANILLRHNFSDDDIQYFFEALNRLNAYQDTTTIEEKETYEEMLNTLNDYGYNIETVMRNLAHSCGTMLKRCMWISVEYECIKLFKLIKTTVGYCCSFNYNNTFDEELNNVHYAPGAGTKLGLKLELDIEESEYIANDNTSKIGVQVLVHSNDAYPDLSLLSYPVESKSFVTLALSSSTLICKDNLRTISVEQRMCLMEDENFLQSTSVYNFETCIIECKMKYIQELCGCTPYYSPIKYNITCTFKHLQCLLAHEGRLANIALKNYDTDDETELFWERLSDDALACFCLPNCNEIKYNTIIEDNPMERLENTSFLHVFFYGISMSKVEREFSVTWDGLLASCGGLFALSLGGSVFNILEIIFYLFKNIIDDLINKINEKLLKRSSRSKVKDADKLFIIYRPKNFYN